MALEIKLVCNVEIVLSADEAVRSQMKFWNDNHTLMYFNMVCSYRGYYCGLSIHLREFDSPTDRQDFSSVLTNSVDGFLSSGLSLYSLMIVQLIFDE